MKILLVGPDHEENLSIRYLSGSLRAAGHDAVLAAFNSAIDASAVVNAAQCADLVGLSICFQARAEEFLALARRIKSQYPYKLVIAGGHYASCAAEALLLNHPEVDLVVIHEGEQALVEIANALPDLPKRLPAISGVVYREGAQVRFTVQRPSLGDLDVLPFPDRRGPIHWIAGVPTSYLMGSRGCYGSCAYCCITTLHRMAPGKRFRQRNVDAVADEMASLYRERGTRQFIFHDDNFLVPSERHNHARISAFEEALRRRGIEGIALVVKCRPADAKPDVLRRLRALGLIRVFLGVESSTARGLQVLDRNQTVEESEAALELCARLGISAQYTLMTFNPDATLDTLRSDIAFMLRFSTNPLNFCRTEIYAGTPLEKRLIESGQAEGDYRGRAYRLLDPVADLSCTTALDLFHFRCWSNSSLMQIAIGLEHAAAVLRHFYSGSAEQELARRIQGWVGRVNQDTIGLLEEVVELSASAGGYKSRAFERAVRNLAGREELTRVEFQSEAVGFSLRLQALRLHAVASLRSQFSPAWARVAKPAAAALLAIAIPVATLGQAAPAQQGQVAPAASQAIPGKGACSLGGRVVDPTTTGVPDARVTITNESTKAERIVTTGSTGEYLANDLTPGPYTIKAEMAGFKTAVRYGIVLKEGAERIDIGLTLEIGCCEYVSVDVVKAQKPRTDLYARMKPFTYVVGQDGDQNTFQDIAKLVYRDSNAWIQIFEANRNVMAKPGRLPYGTAILIPPKKRIVPKRIVQVKPVYPPSAREQKIWGDVLLDVVLKEDGSIWRVSPIEGHPLLAEAAINAVNQWHYRPQSVDGKLVLNFVVVVSFGKNGKVR